MERRREDVVELLSFADEFLKDYLFLTVGVVGGTTSDIDQSVIAVGEYEKKEKLQEILTSTGEPFAPRTPLSLSITLLLPPPPTGADRTLVFVETKRNADYLASLLSQEEFPTTSIHGWVIPSTRVNLYLACLYNCPLWYKIVACPFPPPPPSPI